MLLRGVACAFLVVLAASPASGQETRVEILERQRTEKASQLRPYVPGKLEKALLWVEANDPMTKIGPYNGFFIQYSYTGKPAGSGLAFGGGFRHDLFDRNARVVLEVGQSLRNYQMVRADFSLPWLLDGLLETGVEANYRSHPQEDFYGLGFDSPRDDRVNYKYSAPEFQGRVVVKPAEWLNAGARFGRLNVSLGPGTDSRYPSVEEEFTDADAPGLTAQPDYNYQTSSPRSTPATSRATPATGATLRRLWRRYSDLDLDRYSFHHVDFEAQQFLPIFDKKRVLAARFQLMTTTAGDGQEVPFYFQPTLGGGRLASQHLRLPVPRPQRGSVELRVPLGGVLGPRHGAVLGLRHGGADSRATWSSPTSAAPTASGCGSIPTRPCSSGWTWAPAAARASAFTSSIRRRSSDAQLPDRRVHPPLDRCGAHGRGAEVLPRRSALARPRDAGRGGA